MTQPRLPLIHLIWHVLSHQLHVPILLGLQLCLHTSHLARFMVCLRARFRPGAVRSKSRMPIGKVSCVHLIHIQLALWPLVIRCIASLLIDCYIYNAYFRYILSIVTEAYFLVCGHHTCDRYVYFAFAWYNVYCLLSSVWYKYNNMII